MANLKLALCLIALASIVEFTTGYYSLLLPEQFHCSTELWFYHRELNSGDVFFIDEYVDRPNRRSSLRLTNANKGLDLIYYNQLFGPEDGPVERRFVRYDESKLTCSRQDLYSWHMDQVRKLAIGIMHMDNVSSKNVDIAIGPSGLLYAIESRMGELEFRGSAFDASRLIYTDIYELSIPKPFGKAYNSGKDLLVQVSTFVRNKDIIPDNQMMGKTLADVAFALQYKIHLVSVRVCSVSGAKVKRRTKLVAPYKCQTDALDGQEQDLVASFDLIEDLINDSLIGQPLEKAGQFDFDLNPFAQPVGLGCGKQNRPDYNQRGPSRANTFKAQSNKFSAEYFSLNGLKGLSFIAFDGDRQVMRHDRDGRKNVYDLSRGRSYHVDEFHSIKSMFDQSQATNCVELEIGDDMLLAADDSISVMARLLGVDFVDEAAHIGSKTINDETFSVYELELELGKNAPNSHNLPIIMEPIEFVMPFVAAAATSSNKTRRYFMTYYVLEIPKESLSSSSSAAEAETVKIPRFVELWQLKDETLEAEGGGVQRERSLVNLLEFTQFSWSLNIQPEQEEIAAAGSSSDDDLSRLFSIESCAQDRAEQLLLSFNTIYSTVPADYIGANRQLIRETFHEQLATCLDIPRVNLLSLDFHFSPPQTGIWLIRAKIAELVHGIEQDSLVGYLQLQRSQSWLMAAHLFKGENRHSFDQCKLDSLAMRRSNSIVYCPGLTMCLLVNPEAIEEHRADLYERERANQMRSADEKMAICEVHQFSWRPAPASSDNAPVLGRVYENRNRILRTNFLVELAPPESVQSDKQKPVKYQGFGHGVKLQQLDDTIGRQQSLKSPLTGLRHLAASEDNDAGSNSNYAYKVAANQYFRQCHMACQMDEFCESFSVCKPLTSGSAKSSEFDCVLSTMRLTQNKINDLEEAVRKSSEQRVSIIAVSPFNVDGDFGQVFKFQRATGCSLHSKDILAQFRVARALDLPIDLDATDSDLTKTNGANIVSLDECAGISNEVNLLVGVLEAEFVYCPLESLCLSDSQGLLSTKLDDKAKNSTKMEKCFVYSKSYLNFYDYTLFHKVALHFDGSHALEDDAVQRIGRVIEGLNLEQCARDCNLLQSRCLAFDVCEFETNTTVCTLYTIRSPLAPKTRLGYLPEEHRFYGNNGSAVGGNSATLIENGRCAHFSLKDAYFQLKINHLLEPDSSTTRHKLDDLEQKLLQMDAMMGDNKMIESILGKRNSSGSSDNDNQPNSQQNREEQQVKESSSGSSSSWMIHFVLIISSGVCGALGYLYGGEAKTLTVDTIEYLRARRGQRFAEPRISQLNLPTNLAADL